MSAAKQTSTDTTSIDRFREASLRLVDAMHEASKTRGQIESVQERLQELMEDRQSSNSRELSDQITKSRDKLRYLRDELVSREFEINKLTIDVDCAKFGLLSSGKF